MLLRSWRRYMYPAFLVLMMYVFSIGLTFWNKQAVVIVPFPLTMTLMQVFVKFTVALVLRALCTFVTRRPRVELGWHDTLYTAPTGITAALDIGFSNWSFQYITISLYTMTKSTAIVFILFFSILFRLERKRSSLIVIVVLIALGLFLFTFRSTSFHLEGFLLVLLASATSGLRWTLAQLLSHPSPRNPQLSRQTSSDPSGASSRANSPPASSRLISDSGDDLSQRPESGAAPSAQPQQHHAHGLLSNPIDLMYHVEPFMILALLPLCLAFEGIDLAVSDEVFRTEDPARIGLTLWVFMFGAILATALEFIEFLIVARMSSLTLAVAGICKELIVLLMAAYFHGDRLSGVNMMGLLLCFAGIGLHIYTKTTARNVIAGAASQAQHQRP